MSPKLWPASVSALLLAVLIHGSGAEAQTLAKPGAAAAAASSAGRADGNPADPRAVVPTVQHRSAFAGYRALGVAEPADWRAANDRVARIGGWRAYTREAHAPASAASAAAPAAPASSPRPAPPVPASHRSPGAHSHGAH